MSAAVQSFFTAGLWLTGSVLWLLMVAALFRALKGSRTRR